MIESSWQFPQGCIFGQGYLTKFWNSSGYRVLIRFGNPDENSGFRPDLPWRRSVLSKCSCFIFAFSLTVSQIGLHVDWQMTIIVVSLYTLTFIVRSSEHQNARWFYLTFHDVNWRPSSWFAVIPRNSRGNYDNVSRFQKNVYRNFHFTVRTACHE